MATVWQHLRYTARVLGRDRGFTGVALLSLALGIGANTAILTLINALLLRSLPVQDPQALVEISPVRRDAKSFFSFPMFRELERGQHAFSGLTAWSGSALSNFEVNGELSLAKVCAVTGDYYSVLGVGPLLGRLITPEDADPDSSPGYQVAVLGYEFWQRRFGAARDAIGAQIRIEGQPFTIIGVTRKWFTGMTAGEPPEITIPVTANQLIRSGRFKTDDRSILWLFVTGRLKDGVKPAQARGQLESFWPEVLAATAPTRVPGPRLDAFLGMGLDVTPVASGVATDLRSQFTRPLYVLLGVVALILLMACVNLATLMLARGVGRCREMSVRVALGAPRSMLVRLVFTESLALSVTGAMLGLIFAYWGSRLLVTLMTQGYAGPVALDLRADWRVLGLTGSVTILTGILFGIAPAWGASRVDPVDVLRHDVRSIVRGAGSSGKVLIVAQVALSFVLLLGAGLLVRTFQKLHSLDLGFLEDSVLEVTLSPKPGGNQNSDLNSYHTQLVSSISSIPGVSAVGFSDHFVPSPQGWRELVSPTSADSTARANVTANAMMVSPAFFGTLGIPLRDGRDFDWNDDERHGRIAIVSRGLAERLFPDGRAIGQRIRFGVMPELQALEIVGIANNARVFDLRDASTYGLYLPSLQNPQWARWGPLFIRASGAPDPLVRSVAQNIESLGHEYVLSTRTVAQVTGQLLVPERVTAMLSGFFACLALLLASLGLYGLMSYTITRRTGEVGIRVALGATQQNILLAVLRETLGLALIGIAIGIPSALAAARLVADILFGVSSNDPPTIAGVSLVLLVVASIAGYLPARRACGIDPTLALRTE